MESIHLLTRLGLFLSKTLSLLDAMMTTLQNASILKQGHSFMSSLNPKNLAIVLMFQKTHQCLYWEIRKETLIFRTSIILCETTIG